MYRVDVYLRVRRAVMVEGKSIREVSREFGLHRDTVGKMLAYSVPPGYRRQTPPRRPKLEPFTGVIDRILEDDLGRPGKQRHTAKRIFERLRDEYGFDGGYTTVKDYVREHRRQTKEMFVPLSHAAGHAQCNFGEALVVIGGVKRKAHQTGLLTAGLPTEKFAIRYAQAHFFRPWSTEFITSRILRQGGHFPRFSAAVANVFGSRSIRLMVSHLYLQTAPFLATRP